MVDGSVEIEGLKKEIEKIKKEEQRYIKAFGAEIISMDQFKEAIGDLKMRRAVLEKQVGRLEVNNHDSDLVALPSDDQLNDFTESAALVLKNHLSFDKKQVIIRKVVDTIIAQQTRLVVRGYLPIREEVQNYVKFQSECRNSRITKCWEVDTF